MPKYYINWNDPPFPQIRVYVESANRWETPQSFTACKQEIYEKFQSDLEFAKSQLAAYRSMRVSDIETDTTEEI